MTDRETSLEDLLRQVERLQKQTHHQEELLARCKQKSCHYEDLVEYAVDAIFLGDSQGNLTSANHSAVALSGYQQSELLGMNLAQLFSAEEQQRSPLRYDLLQQGKSVQTERLLTRKDGTLVSVEMHSRMMPDGSYHSFMRDLTGRRQMEEALRRSEEKFSRAFHLNPDAINITRLADGSYIEINQGFTDSMGWTAADVLDRKSLRGDLDIWCRAEDRQRLLLELEKTGEVNGLEATFRHKNGQLVIGLMSARIIEIADEPCILSITRNITERVKAQKQQQQLEQQLRHIQKLDSLGVLAGGIAHDFNNILMAVLGHCELALRRVPEQSIALNNLQQIKLAAGKAADLANQMLAYSGKGKFITEPLQLSAVVAEMEQLLAISVSKKALIRYDLAARLPSIEADATQVRQVIMNLVINASDALGDQHGHISIATGVRSCTQEYFRDSCLNENLPAGDYVYLTVRDSGCGLSAETAARIFEPFFTTKHTGRGLGMAAVLGIVRGHNGAIKLDTEVGKGSNFKILFPASSKEANASVRQQSILPLKNSGLVLLVDDEELVRSTGREMLAELGFAVLTARNGREAVAIFRAKQSQIRLVLLDMTMPEMDGAEALQHLRSIDPAVKVIICSGYNEQEITAKFAPLELAGFLKKPFQLATLQKLIQNAF